MRAGPPSSVLARGVMVGARVAVLRGGVVLAPDVPAWDVVLEYTGKRDVPSQVTYRAPLDWLPSSPLDPLATFGQRSQVTAIYRTPDGAEWDVDLGYYVHTGWQQGDGWVEVTASDLLQLLDDDPMPWPSSPARGVRVRAELTRLAGHLPVILDVGVPDAPVPRTSQWGTSRIEAVRALADSKGFGLRVSSDGALHAYRLADASRPAVTFRAGETLIDAPAASVVRRPNRWVATGTKTEGYGDDAVETRWTATRANYTRPFDPDSYGRITSVIEVSAADSQADVEAAVDRQMRADLYATRQRTITVVPDARVEVGDVVGVVGGDGETFAGRVTGFTLPLTDSDADMDIDLDILEW